MRSCIRFGAASLLALLLTTPLRLQGQGRAIPVIILDHGAREFADPLSQLSSMIEMRDGRVLVVDPKEKELRVLDFARSTSAVVAHVGNSPPESHVSGMLFRGSRDSVLYYDPFGGRSIILSPTAKPVRTDLHPVSDLAVLSQMIPVCADSTGRLYGQTMGMPGVDVDALPDPPKLTDSVDVLSRDRTSGRTTKLARIRNATTELQPSISISGNVIKMTVRVSDFRPQDVWAVLPDGRVAILRNGLYRVHFITAGRPEALGPDIPFAPIPVTSRERQAMVDSVRRQLDVTIRFMRKATAGVRGGLDYEGTVAEPTSWAAIKPPYTSLRSSPDARLWVATSQPAGVKTARLDVLDSNGKLIAQVQLLAGELLAGLGRGTVYTVRADDDGLLYLRRYTLPAIH